MAQRVVVHMIDDVDGGEAAETVAFGLDGVAYEIDVSTANAEALRTDLSRFVSHARRVTSRSSTRAKAKAPTRDRAAVRAWARENGYEVSARGRTARGRSRRSCNARSPR